jgi:hypothetical protein
LKGIGQFRPGELVFQAASEKANKTIGLGGDGFGGFGRSGSLGGALANAIAAGPLASAVDATLEKGQLSVGPAQWMD